MARTARVRRKEAERIHDRRATELPVNSVVSIAIVPDPYSEVGGKIQVLRSIRDDPLAGMLARRQIDDAQFAAGRRWQYLHEASTIGVIRAIDPAKESVDGGKPPESITDRQISAFRQLSDAYTALREHKYGLGALIFDILGERMTITQAADKRGCFTFRQVVKTGEMFREALEVLAVHFGFAA